MRSPCRSCSRTMATVRSGQAKCSTWAFRGQWAQTVWQDAASWEHNGSPEGKEHESQGDGRNLTPHIGQGVAMHFVATPDASEQADYDAANRAIAHLEKHRADPFFLGLGFVRPHVPFVAPG